MPDNVYPGVYRGPVLTRIDKGLFNFALAPLFGGSNIERTVNADDLRALRAEIDALLPRDEDALVDIVPVEFDENGAVISGHNRAAFLGAKAAADAAKENFGR